MSPLPSHLTTDRLALRPLVGADEAECLAAFADFEVVRWLAAVPWPYRAGDFRSFLDAALPAGRWAITRGGEFLGMIGLDLQFGYWLRQEVWGQGVATEAAHAVLDAHFTRPEGGTVFAGYFPGNARSARVLTKLGFVEIGTGNVHSLALDCVQAHVELELCRDDYLALR